MALQIVARKRVAGGREWWVVGVVLHHGRPFVDELEYKCRTRTEALAEGDRCYRHCDTGSLTAEMIAQHGGLAA